MTPNPNPSPELLALRAIKAVTATAKDAVAGLSRIMAITRSAGVEQPYSELLNDADVRLIVERPRIEWAHLLKPAIDGCALPPAGWRCTRDRGHAGPCATVAALSPQTLPAPGEVELACAMWIAGGNDASVWDNPQGSWVSHMHFTRAHMYSLAAPIVAVLAASSALATVAAANDEGVAEAYEAAAKVCDDLASTAASIQAAIDLSGGEAPIKNAQRETAEILAAAIRLLSQGEGK